MAKGGIKINELARRLGVTPRTLLDRCRAEGMSVQNSITRLTPPQAETVRRWFGDGDEGGAADEADHAGP